jgi:hypothetical protein
MVLGKAIGLPWALALVGVGHAAVGGWGLVRVKRAVAEVHLLDRSRDELERSLHRVEAAAGAPPPALPAGEKRS